MTLLAARRTTSRSSACFCPCLRFSRSADDSSIFSARLRSPPPALKLTSDVSCEGRTWLTLKLSTNGIPPSSEDTASSSEASSRGSLGAASSSSSPLSMSTLRHGAFGSPIARVLRFFRRPNTFSGSNRLPKTTSSTSSQVTRSLGSPFTTLPCAPVFSIPEPSSPLSKAAIVRSISRSLAPGLRARQRSEQYLIEACLVLVAFLASGDSLHSVCGSGGAKRWILTHDSSAGVAVRHLLVREVEWRRYFRIGARAAPSIHPAHCESEVKGDIEEAGWSSVVILAVEDFYLTLLDRGCRYIVAFNHCLSNLCLLRLRCVGVWQWHPQEFDSLTSSYVEHRSQPISMLHADRGPCRSRQGS